MKRTVLLNCVLGVLMAVMLVGCDNQPKFTIEGQISNADSSVIYLEKRGMVSVALLDSAKLDKTGNFKFKSPAPENPDLYILRLNGQIINLSVDSVETITVKADKKNFSTDYTVEGSDASKRIKQTMQSYYKLSASIESLKKQFNNKEITEEDYVNQITSALKEYKDQARHTMMVDLKSPSAYFALFQKIDGILLFDPYDKADSKMYGAVATAWDMYYKDTERAKHLHSFTINAMNAARQANQAASLTGLENLQETTGLLNISLPDANGHNKVLSDLKGKVVLLDFTTYNAEFSPQHNIMLNQLLSKFKGSLEIYQVSFDADLHLWKNAVENLPWIAVRDADGVESKLFSTYNIGGLPTAFLLSKNGDVVVRLSGDTNIEKEIQKLL